MSAGQPVIVGAVLWIDLPTRVPRGHEQEGMRPCVVLADPSTVQTLRYPALVVAPLSTVGLPPGPLYPILKTGMGGLKSDSTVLLDQVLSVDVQRVKGFIGQLTAADYGPVRVGLEAMFK